MVAFRIFIILLLAGLLGCQKALQGDSVSYYLHPSEGSLDNDGLSADCPFKSLDQLESITIFPGDRLLLASGEVFSESLFLEDIAGTEKEPIVISTYGSSEPAKILAADGLHGLHLRNTAFVEVSNLDISTATIDTLSNRWPSMRCGLLVDVDKAGVFKHIYLKNIWVHDVFYQREGYARSAEEVRTANGTQNYGWGIRFITHEVPGAELEDLHLDSIRVENVAHTGIKFSGRMLEERYSIAGIKLSNSRVSKTGGPGIQMSGVQDVHVFGNWVDQSGSSDDTRKWGRGSGLWTWGSDRVLIEHNRFTNANGPGDSAGAHIDFNCSNVVLQYNLSVNNAGGFCEILGNNYNCAYRYNVSYNDGHRVKGVNGAFQEGKVFWLSGYVGNGKEKAGPFNSYFYNNTIVVSDSIQAKMAIADVAEGICVVNNVFMIEGKAELVKSDQSKSVEVMSGEDRRAIFRNNLFLHAESWPKVSSLQDEFPLFGNAGVEPSDLYRIDSYIPGNQSLLVNRGIEIPFIPGDSIGLELGLRVSHDILGNPILGKPDLGAFELK